MKTKHTVKNGFSGWQLVEVIYDVKTNSGYVLPTANNDPAVRSAMERVRSELTAKYPKNQQILIDTKCVNVTHINACVVMCDVELWAKITTNRTSYKSDKKVSPRKQIKSDKYLITFIDEDGDTSEETFEGSEDGLVEVLNKNFHKFGLKLHALKRNGRKYDGNVFEVGNYRYTIA